LKRGDRVVHGDKELFEKLGRNDLCHLRLGTPVLAPAASSRAGFVDRDYYTCRASVPVAQQDQSAGLRIRRLEVQILPGAPASRRRFMAAGFLCYKESA
jgi:hypothetical protein